MKKVLLALIFAVPMLSAAAMYSGYIKDIPWMELQSDKLVYHSGDEIHLAGTISNIDTNYVGISLHEANGVTVYSQSVSQGLTTKPIYVVPGHYYIEVGNGNYVERINILFT